MLKSSAPSVFISHGAPNVALLEDDYTIELRKFGLEKLTEVRGIVCLSAHWQSSVMPEITYHASPGVIHDFGGFQKELYDLDYSAKGDPNLALRLSDLLKKNGMDCLLNPHRKWDHGVWIPLRIMRPEADIPVVQLSLPQNFKTIEILRLGKALSELRKEGIMIMGSGGAAHNLNEISWHRAQTADPRIIKFTEWLVDRVSKGRITELLDFEEMAPESAFAHPTTEHLLPLFVTLGAALPGDRYEAIYEGYRYHSLSLFSFALRQSPLPPTSWGIG